MKQQGIVSRWQDQRGIGFIEREGYPALFFHISAYQGQRRPSNGEKVYFTVGKDVQGRECAEQVIPVAKSSQYVTVKRHANQQMLTANNNDQILNSWLVIAIGFMLTLIWLVIRHTVSMAVLGWYIAISLATFLLYAHDKKAAERNSWRVQEATLHKLAIAGGWVGAAFAQKFLRHKSKKAEFRKIYYLTVLGNIIGLIVIWYIKFYHAVIH